MAIKVKICGVDRQETVEASVDAGASMIGLVFFEKSPRFLSLTRATSITQNIPKSVKKVGLFVDPTNTEISEVIENVKIDTIDVFNMYQNFLTMSFCYFIINCYNLLYEHQFNSFIHYSR